MKRNNILTIAGILIAGSAIYFGIKWYQKRQEEKNQLPKPDPVVTPGSNPTDLAPSDVENPFITVEEVKAFQDWMDAKHPNWVNGKNLNKGQGYGNFGPSTKSAYTTYGAEYLKSLQPAPAQLTEDQKKDIQTIMAHGTGDKSKESYQKASVVKYPSYTANWAKAIRKRLETGGKQGTTFIFANQIYESYSGNRIYSGLLFNKKPETKSNAKLRQDAKWTTSTQPANGFDLGKITGYFYNKTDKALFVYVPDNKKSSIYKWIWVGSIKF
jgi:hypothetical protein